RCSGCWSHDGEVAGGAVADFVLVISGSRRRPRRSQVRVQLRHDPIATASLGALTLFLHPYTRARALMARQWSARCYGVARQREGSRQNSLGGSGVLSLRHFGLVLFIPWRVGAEESGAAKYGFGGAMLLDRLGPPGA